MTEYSMQFACSPATGDSGPLTVENIEVARLMMGNYMVRDAGVIYWTDSTYVPQVAGGLANAVDGLLEPSQAGGVVTIASGVGHVNGFIYFNDDDVDFDIDSNPGNANATDYIVMQWISSNQSVRLVRLNGPAGTSPTLTQTTTQWEVLIASVDLDAGGLFSALNDERVYVKSPESFQVDWLQNDGSSLWGTPGTTDTKTSPDTLEQVGSAEVIVSSISGAGLTNVTFPVPFKTGTSPILTVTLIVPTTGTIGAFNPNIYAGHTAFGTENSTFYIAIDTVVTPGADKTYWAHWRAVGER